MMTTIMMTTIMIAIMMTMLITVAIMTTMRMMIKQMVLLLRSEELLGEPRDQSMMLYQLPVHSLYITSNFENIDIGHINFVSATCLDRQPICERISGTGADGTNDLQLIGADGTRVICNQHK